MSEVSQSDFLLWHDGLSRYKMFQKVQTILNVNVKCINQKFEYFESEKGSSRMADINKTVLNKSGHTVILAMVNNQPGNVQAIRQSLEGALSFHSSH